jgi:hypothetical protein
VEKLPDSTVTSLHVDVNTVDGTFPIIIPKVDPSTGSKLKDSLTVFLDLLNQRKEGIH